MIWPKSKINITDIKFTPTQEAFMASQGIQWSGVDISSNSETIHGENSHMNGVPAHMAQVGQDTNTHLEEQRLANERLLNALPRAPGVRDVAAYTQPDTWMVKRGVQMPAVYDPEAVALAVKAVLRGHIEERMEAHDYDVLQKLSTVMADMILSERSNNTRATDMAVNNITTRFSAAVDEVNLLKEGLKRLIASTETLKKELATSHSTNRQLRETNRQLLMRGSSVKPTRKIRRR